MNKILVEIKEFFELIHNPERDFILE